MVFFTLVNSTNQLTGVVTEDGYLTAIGIAHEVETIVYTGEEKFRQTPEGIQISMIVDALIQSTNPMLIAEDTEFIYEELANQRYEQLLNRALVQFDDFIYLDEYIEQEKISRFYVYVGDSEAETDTHSH